MAMSMAVIVVQLAAAFVSVPLILAEVGIEGYGVWALAQMVIAYIVTVQAGIGPSLQRYTTLAVTQGDRDAVLRLLWTGVVLYAGIGAVCVALSFALDEALVALFDVPQRLEADAATAFRLTGPVIALALFGAGFASMLAGLQRYTAMAVTSALAALAYLIGLVVFFARDLELPGILWAAGLGQLTLVLARAWTLRDVVLGGTPRLLTRTDLRPFLSFSAGLQISVLAALITNQTDKLIVGLIAPLRTVGQLAIGAQLAESGRAVMGASLNPLVTRLTFEHGSDEGDVAAVFRRLNRLWVLGITGVTVVGIASAYPFIVGWLGAERAAAAPFAAMLILAQGMVLLAGGGAAYLRALGRPGLEARLGMLMVGLNLGLTVVLGLLAGAHGVVAATAVANSLAVAWFYRRLGGIVPGWRWPSVAAVLRTLGYALLAGAAALGAGLAAVELVPTGFALVPVAAAGAGALLLYLWKVTGVVPSPRVLRALLAVPPRPAADSS